LTSIANILPDFKIDYPDSFDKWTKFFESIDINRDLPPLPEIASRQEKIFLASRNILSDFYSIKSEEERFKKYSIYAPFNGSITEVYTEVGAVANPGAKLATIIQTDKLELEVPVEVDDINWIDIGDDTHITTEEGAGNWTGKVIRKADFVDHTTQSISVFVSLDPEATKQLYQGEYLRAVFPGKIIKQAMEIPRNAVFNFDEVFTVIDGKLVKDRVEIKKVNEESMVISGLDQGVMLVVEPLINAVENSSVEIL
jgi:RND family efflux transporter MFP subunit